MTNHLRIAVLASAALFALSACDRGRQPPAMNAAALDDDDRGAKAGRFLPPADNGADANDTMASNAANESTP